MRKTDLYIIIDEETLETVKLNGKVMKFKSESIANYYAGSRLNVWSVFHVNFTHNFIGHDL